MKEHNWKQQSICFNGPHVWQCVTCGLSVRSYEKPQGATCGLEDEIKKFYDEKLNGQSTRPT